MTGISVGFTIVTPGSMDPAMYFGLEVKWLRVVAMARDITCYMHGYVFKLQPPTV